MTPKRLLCETHWYYNQDASLQEVLGAGITLAQQRSFLLPNNCKIIEVRASVENIYSDSLVLSQIVNYEGPGAFGNFNLSIDAIKIQLYSTSRYHTVLNLGPVPDGCISNDAYVPTKPPGFDIELTNFLDVLTGSNFQAGGIWGFVGVTRDPLVFPRAEIRNIQGNFADTFATVTTITPHNLQPGDVVRISRWPFASAQYPFNTLWVVGGATLFTFLITGLDPIMPSFALGGGGYAYGCKRTWHPYTAYRILRPGTLDRADAGTLCSWEIMEREFQGLLDPGCYAMGIMSTHRTYFTKAHIFRDDDTEVTLRWFRVPDDTPFLPVPHLWAGRPWRYDRTPPTLGPGELTQYKTTHAPGFPPVIPSAWRGSDDWWANGVPFAAVGTQAQVRASVCQPCAQFTCAEGINECYTMPLVWVMDDFTQDYEITTDVLVQETAGHYTSNATEDVIGCPGGTSRAWFVDLPTDIIGLTSQIITQREPYIFSSCDQAEVP